MIFLHPQQDFESLHLKGRDVLISHYFDPLLEAGQATNVCHIALANDPDAVVSGGFYLGKILVHALTGFTVQRK
jgi:hypothetical protein